MAFDQTDDPATREAATARVQQRLMTNPGDRSVFRVVSDEFSVGEQSLRAWVEAATPDAPAPKKRRPKFTPVIKTKVERVEVAEPAPEPTVEQTDAATPTRPTFMWDTEPGSGVEPEPEPELEPELEPAARPKLAGVTVEEAPANADSVNAPPAEALPPEPGPTRLPESPSYSSERVVELEFELVRIRSDIQLFKAVMKVLLRD